MTGLNNRLNRNEGAFRPISGCFSSDFTKNIPPQRFVATQAVGGLKNLLSKLSSAKNTSLLSTSDSGSNTSDIGAFKQCAAVPNLAERYKVLQLIGKGQSAIIVAAEDLHHPTKQVVAVKIMNLDYTTLGAQEADCILQLNKADPLKVSKIIRLLNKCMFHGHFCMVFELLRPKPLHHYFQTCTFDTEDEKLEKIREIAVQVLGVLGFLRCENVIHADLKPENILLESGDKIKIRVVDFGNAIRWIHQEMSLYYDSFELQTLLYRAPEVMFGVPFGPEIDMWSLGCILAELYLGKPLFWGQTKKEVLQEMVSLLGPFPRIPFQSGKFYSEFAGFLNARTGPSLLSHETRLMKILHNTKNFTFANFLSRLLQYNPNQRFTPVQAASHPFLAAHVSFADFLSNVGDEPQGVRGPRRSGVLLTPSQYTHRPHIDDDIRRQHLSAIDLFYAGTRSRNASPKRTSTPPVGRVVPLVNCKTTENTEETSPPVHSGRSVNTASNVEPAALAENTRQMTCASSMNSTAGKRSAEAKIIKLTNNAVPQNEMMTVSRHHKRPEKNEENAAKGKSGKGKSEENEAKGKSLHLQTPARKIQPVARLTQNLSDQPRPQVAQAGYGLPVPRQPIDQESIQSGEHSLSNEKRIMVGNGTIEKKATSSRLITTKDLNATKRKYRVASDETNEPYWIPSDTSTDSDSSISSARTRLYRRTKKMKRTDSRPKQQTCLLIRGSQEMNERVSPYWESNTLQSNTSRSDSTDDERGACAREAHSPSIKMSDVMGSKAARNGFIAASNKSLSYSDDKRTCTLTRIDSLPKRKIELTPPEKLEKQNDELYSSSPRRTSRRSLQLKYQHEDDDVMLL